MKKPRSYFADCAQNRQDNNDDRDHFLESFGTSTKKQEDSLKRVASQ
jgi:hypothetical protein